MKNILEYIVLVCLVLVLHVGQETRVLRSYYVYNGKLNDKVYSITNTTNNCPMIGFYSTHKNTIVLPRGVTNLDDKLNMKVIKVTDDYIKLDLKKNK